MREFLLLFKYVLLISLLAASISLFAQDKQNLTEALVDQRINTLRESGSDDLEETLKAYMAIKPLLNSAKSHKHDTAKHFDQQTNAPQREAAIQARIDTMQYKHNEVLNLENLSIQELESELMSIQASISYSNETLDKLEYNLTTRESNADLLRTRLSEIDAQLKLLQEQPTSFNPDTSPSMTEAYQWLAAAELIALREEKKSKSTQLDSQPIRYSIMHLESAELKLKINNFSTLAKQFIAQLNINRQKIATIPTLNIDDNSPAYELGQQYLAKSVELTEQRIKLEFSLAEVNTKREKVQQSTRILNERFTRAQRLVNFAKDSDVLGEILPAYWEEINRLDISDPSHKIPRQLADTVISRMDHEEEFSRIINASSSINTSFSRLGLDVDDILQTDLDILFDLIRQQRESLRNIITIESSLIDMLSELKLKHTVYANRITEYRSYLEPLVLWIPSNVSLWRANFKGISDEAVAIIRTLQGMKVSLQPTFFISSTLLLFLIYFRTRLRSYQYSQNKMVSRPQEDLIRFTLVALVISILRSLAPVLFVTMLASLFYADKGTASLSLTSIMGNLAVWMFAAALLNVMCEDAGVAKLHFNWNTQRCERLKREARLFMLYLLPSTATVSFLYSVADSTIISRLAMLAMALWLVFHFSKNLWQRIKYDSTKVLSSLENRIRFILTVVFIAIAFGVIFGLHLSVSFIIVRIIDLLAVGIGLIIGYNFLLRWLKLVSRRLRFEELLESRNDKIDPPSVDNVIVEEKLDSVTDIGEESLQLLNMTIIIVTLVSFYYMIAPILPFFDAMSNIILWTSTSIVEGESSIYRITLDILFFVLLLISITLYASQKLPAVVELALRSRTNISSGSRYTISTLLNYVILGTGILLSLSKLGLDWSELQWLVAALGVGIGFGLQEIVANFISGLIILFERPISVGDVITVGDKDGVVTRIRIRATTIRDWDNKELLIPNKEIITGRLLNWSLSDTKLRLSIPIGITYGSDVELALQILNEIVVDEERVIVDPAPSVIFSGFGENALNLVCRFYIDRLGNYWPVKTDLNLEIYRRFKDVGIIIAFPQRDVHFDSEKPLHISIDSRHGNGK